MVIVIFFFVSVFFFFYSLRYIDQVCCEQKFPLGIAFSICAELFNSLSFANLISLLSLSGGLEQRKKPLIAG